MVKYSYELKKIVEEYLNGNASHKILAKKYQIGVSQIRHWVNNYKHFGDEGLMRSRNKREYSVEFKLENRIKELEAENRNLIIQKMFWEQLRSLVKDEEMSRRRESSPNSENNSN